MLFEYYFSVIHDVLQYLCEGLSALSTVYLVFPSSACGKLLVMSFYYYIFFVIVSILQVQSYKNRF